MKILLDENLPRKLKLEFAGHQVAAVREMGWSGKKNGEILALAASNNFDAFVTADKKLPSQQDLSKHPFAVILLNPKNSRLETFQRLMPSVLNRLKGKLLAGLIEITE